MIYNSRLPAHPFFLDEALLQDLIQTVKYRLEYTPKTDWSLSLIRHHVVESLPSNHYVNIRQPWCDAVITVLIDEGYLNDV